jgi:hypothetical protein
MYWKGEDDKEQSFKRDIMDYFSKYARPDSGYIVASASSDFTDGEGDNPPHKKARRSYEAIVKAGRFICTHEYPNADSPLPLVFTVDANGFACDDKRAKSKGPDALARAVLAARGASTPPSTQTIFGARK